MVASILSLLIYLVILGLVFYLAVYVLGALGITVPQKVVQLVGVLVVLLVLLSFFGGYVEPLPFFRSP